MENQVYRNHRTFISPRSLPFDTFISQPTNASLPYNNLLNLPPPTPSPSLNPYQESIDYLFSRLHVSDPNPQSSYPAFHHRISLGSNQDRLLLGNQLFQLHQLARDLPIPNNAATDYFSPTLQNHVSYSDSSSSGIDLWDNSLYGTPRFRNSNGLTLPDSRGFLNGLGHGLLSRSNDPARSSYIYNRMPNYSAVEYLPLQYLSGKIVSFAKDQSGCRLVQRTIENLTKEEIDMVLFEVIEFVAELMIDPFGNYVAQKLIEVCSEEQRTRILLSVTKKQSLVTICLNTHGTRAVQKLLERITSPQQVSIVMSALTPGAVALTKDMNGHHVIKHCLERFSAEDNKYLLNVVANNCFDIATDKSGCCVLQQCVERSTGETQDSLVAEITTHALLLAEHQFGNYVVQHILGLKDPRITANLLRQLEGHFAVLACNKYGSNVVEKCLYESRGEQSTQIVLELLRSRNFSMLLVDPYGNFVIQAALSVSKGAVLRTFLEMIEASSPRMRNNIYGQKVLTWLHRKRVQYT